MEDYLKEMILYKKSSPSCEIPILNLSSVIGKAAKSPASCLTNTWLSSERLSFLPSGFQSPEDQVLEGGTWCCNLSLALVW